MIHWIGITENQALAGGVAFVELYGGCCKKIVPNTEISQMCKKNGESVANANCKTWMPKQSVAEGGTCHPMKSAEQNNEDDLEEFLVGRNRNCRIGD